MDDCYDNDYEISSGSKPTCGDQCRQKIILLSNTITGFHLALCRGPYEETVAIT